MNDLKTGLETLLNRLDAIARVHEEIGDTDVREELATAVYHGVMVRTPGYALPETFGLFEPAGDAAVRAALQEFLAVARSLELSSPELRFAAFQDAAVRSEAGNSVGEYFGRAGSFAEWSAFLSCPPTRIAPTRPKPWWRFWAR